jgi:hypothetical protein
LAAIEEETIVRKANSPVDPVAVEEATEQGDQLLSHDRQTDDLVAVVVVLVVAVAWVRLPLSFLFSSTRHFCREVAEAN